MKKFDIENFNKYKNNNVYSYKLNESTTVKQQESNAGYFEFIKSNNNDFGIMNRYYNSGKLMLSIEYFPNDFIAGIKKEYDEQGNLIKETDLDKPFTYTWKDIKKYLEKHGVKDFHKDIVDIERFNNPDKTYWSLRFIGNYKDIKGQFLIELDGKTGEELLVKLFKGKGSEGEVGTIAIIPIHRLFLLPSKVRCFMLLFLKSCNALRRDKFYFGYIKLFNHIVF